MVNNTIRVAVGLRLGAQLCATVLPLKIRDIFSSFKSHILNFKRLSLLVDRRFAKIRDSSRN